MAADHPSSPALRASASGMIGLGIAMARLGVTHARGPAIAAGRSAPDSWSTTGTIQQELSAIYAGVRPYPPYRVPRDIRRVGSPLVIFHGWFARSHAGRRNRLTPRARRSARHQASRKRQ